MAPSPGLDSTLSASGTDTAGRCGSGTGMEQPCVRPQAPEAQKAPKVAAVPIHTGCATEYLRKHIENTNGGPGPRALDTETGTSVSHPNSNTHPGKSSMQEGLPALKQSHFTAWSYEVRTESHCTDTGNQHKEKQQHANTGTPSWAQGHLQESGWPGTSSHSAHNGSLTSSAAHPAKDKNIHFQIN